VYGRHLEKVEKLRSHSTNFSKDLHSLCDICVSCILITYTSEWRSVLSCDRGVYGLWLDGDLYHGRTQWCMTYDNDLLTTSEDFMIKCLEVWTFTWTLHSAGRLLYFLTPCNVLQVTLHLSAVYIHTSLQQDYSDSGHAIPFSACDYHFLSFYPRTVRE